jgi:hypothetical protein
MMPPTQRRSTSVGPTRRGTVVGDGVEDLAGVLDPGIDDFQGWNHILGCAQNVGETHTGTLKGFAKQEGELNLNARYAVVGVNNLRTIVEHHVVEQVPVVRLIYLRGPLHGLGGEAHLVTDELAALPHLAILNQVLDCVGILKTDVWPDRGQLLHRFAVTLGLQEHLTRLLSISIGQHSRAFISHSETPYAINHMPRESNE